MRRLQSVGMSVLLLIIGVEGAVAQVASNERGPWRFRAGLSTAGFRELDVVGVGIIGEYHHPPAWHGIRAGAEALLVHSGERRVPVREACNAYFLADTAQVSHVYEQIGSVGIGGALSVPIRQAPDDLGFYLPGVAAGIGAGIMFETDRVGLQSSDMQTYYGYSAPSDTDVLLRLYLRPQITLNQGGFSLSGSVLMGPRFASWTVGVAYSW